MSRWRKRVYSSPHCDRRARGSENAWGIPDFWTNRAVAELIGLIDAEPEHRRDDWELCERLGVPYLTRQTLEAIRIIPTIRGSDLTLGRLTIHTQTRTWYPARGDAIGDIELARRGLRYVAISVENPSISRGDMRAGHSGSNFATRHR